MAVKHDRRRLDELVEEAVQLRQADPVRALDSIVDAFEYAKELYHVKGPGGPSFLSGLFGLGTTVGKANEAAVSLDGLLRQLTQLSNKCDLRHKGPSQTRIESVQGCAALFSIYFEAINILNAAHALRGGRRARRPKGSGSVYMRKDGLWIGEITIGGERRTVSGATEEEADARLNEMRTQQEFDNRPPSVLPEWGN